MENKNKNNSGVNNYFCISVAEEDGEDDEEVASNGQQARHHIGHHVAEHYLVEV